MSLPFVPWSGEFLGDVCLPINCACQKGCDKGMKWASERIIRCLGFLWNCFFVLWNLVLLKLMEKVSGCLALVLTYSQISSIDKGKRKEYVHVTLPVACCKQKKHGILVIAAFASLLT